MKRLIAGATVIACMLMVGAAFAKDHDRDDHKGKGHERVEGRWDRDRDRGVQHRDVRWDRDHDRDHRPPGWDKGKKKGWGDCDVPPGQAKKHGCYDRDRHHHARRVTHHRPTTTQRQPVRGVWQHPRPTTSTTTTTTRTANVGTWRRPTATQQTTTTTTAQPAPTNGTWRK